MIYSEAEARELVIRAGLELCEKKLIARTWGNISARISEEEFIITPSGRAYDALTPSDLVKVRIADCTYEGDIKPSSEKGVHAAAYALRENVGFIIHTHQFYASALCAEERDYPFAPCAAYGLPGTDKLKKAVAETVKAHPESSAFLMAKHGALCLGDDYSSAFSTAYSLEEKCRAEFDSRVSFESAVQQETLPSVSIPGCVIEDTSCFVLACASKYKRIPAYIDDFAQLVGPGARCVSVWSPKALKGRNAALIKGRGAFCVSEEADDAEAVSMILQKNCAALLYARDAKPLGFIDSRLQRYIYLNKYSKQKNSK